MSRAHIRATPSASSLLENTGAAVAFQAGDHSVVDIPLSFEAAERTARISYTSDGKVAGLHFLPPGFT